MKTTTPVGCKIDELKDWITGREEREINNILLSSAQFDAHGMKGFDASTTIKADDNAFEIIVKSVDGATDDLLNRILDLHSKDYAFVKEKVNEVRGIVEGAEQKKKI